jgi:crossover junction endodeoxyribonuclease RusA
MNKIIIKTKPVSVNAMYRGGRRFLTKEGKSAKESISWELKKQYRGKALGCDIGLDIDFYVPNQRSDLDNLLKGLLDCLTGIIYIDDKQIVEILARKYVDKKEPRIEIIINELS